MMISLVQAKVRRGHPITQVTGILDPLSRDVTISVRLLIPPHSSSLVLYNNVYTLRIVVLPLHSLCAGQIASVAQAAQQRTIKSLRLKFRKQKKKDEAAARTERRSMAGSMFGAGDAMPGGMFLGEPCHLRGFMRFS